MSPFPPPAAHRTLCGATPTLLDPLGPLCTPPETFQALAHFGAFSWLELCDWNVLSTLP